MREGLYVGWDSGDRAATSRWLDGDFEYVNPGYAVDPGIRRGHDGWAKVQENLDASFSEQRHEVGEDPGSGDRVLCHTRFSTAHPAADSGAPIDIPEQHLWTLRDGKIVRLEWFHDPCRGRASRPHPARRY